MIKWNQETCFEEAKKYKTKVEFMKNASGAYAASLKNKWINNYTWFEKPIVHNKKWTYETCYNEALKYKSNKEFKNKNCGAYSAAHKNGWMKDYTWFIKFSKPIGYWTKERCYEEALKYKSRSEFQKNSPTAYDKSNDNKWMDDYTWFIEKPKKNYWTKERCYEEALKYKTKKEFREKCSSAHSISYTNGWMKDYTWMTNTLSEKKEYIVYCYKDEETNSVYIGLTNNLNRRHKQHCNGILKHGIKTFDTVYNYFNLIKKEIPFPIILKDNLIAKDAQYYEKYYIEKYKLDGLNVINLAKGGSLGAFSYWTYEKCFEEAKKYTTKIEFIKNSNSAYDVARKNKWLDDYVWFVELHHNWTKNECYQEALKYKSRKEFQNNSPSIYQIARKNKWLNDYIWFKTRLIWTYESCYEEAKKYKTKIEFIKNSYGAYQCAQRNGWLKDYTWFVKAIPSNKKWTYETCYEEAKKYKTKKELKEKNRSLHTIVYRNGWVKDYTWLEPLKKVQ